MKYHKHQGIVLKKQNYREADQIITVWTRQEGKIRILARGVRKSTSKLSYSLQELAFVEIEATSRSGNLATLISSQTVKNFRFLRNDLGKIASGFFAAELMLKMTADEQPNEEAFNLLLDFYNYLDNRQTRVSYIFPAREAFCLKLLKILGFGLSALEKQQTMTEYIQDLGRLDFSAAQEMNIDPKYYQQIHTVVIDFVESVLERNLKSKMFLKII